MIKNDLRKEVEIATSWDEEELQPLNCDAFQLTGFSFSNEEVTLDFRHLSKEPELGEQMLFRIQGELFYCDEVRWVAFDAEGADYPEDAPEYWKAMWHEFRKRNPKLFDYYLSCRVVSRC